MDEARSRNQLVLSNGETPKSLDPHVGSDLSSARIYTALFEGLIVPDAHSLEPRPGVAHRWEVSQDGLTYTFYLRKDAKWSNGEPLLSHDFVFSFRRILEPQFGSSNSRFLYPIRNAKAFNLGKIADFDQVGASALDNHTLVIELEKPMAAFLSYLNHWAWYPVHPGTVRAFGGEFSQDKTWTRPENIVSNGPFCLKSIYNVRVFELEQNPYYWDRASVLLSGLKFIAYDHYTTENWAFRKNQIHVASSALFNHEMTDLENRSIRKHPELSVYGYWINTSVGAQALPSGEETDSPPLHRKEVREALSLALDRRALLASLSGGVNTPTLHWVPKADTQAGAAEPSLKENLGRARLLLEELGYKDGEGFPPITLTIDRSGLENDLAQEVKAQWESRLGLQVGIEIQDWKLFLGRRRKGHYHIARGGWTAEVNDPQDFLDILRRNHPQNHSRWSNDGYDRLLEAAETELDPKQRLALLRDAEGILMAESPVIPLYFKKNTYLVRPEVKGFEDNVLGLWFYKGVHFGD